jgi:hypothetical protein
MITLFILSVYIKTYFQILCVPCSVFNVGSTCKPVSIFVTSLRPLADSDRGIRNLSAEFSFGPYFNESRIGLDAFTLKLLIGKGNE